MTPSLIRPPRLKRGDKVALIAPASPPSAATLCATFAAPPRARSTRAATTQLAAPRLLTRMAVHTGASILMALIVLAMPS